MFQYENLRNQAASMKERYEEKISDLEEERDAILDKGRQLQLQTQHLQQSLRQAETQVNVQTSVSREPASQDVATEVRVTECSGGSLNNVDVCLLPLWTI